VRAKQSLTDTFGDKIPANTRGTIVEIFDDNLANGSTVPAASIIWETLPPYKWTITIQSKGVVLDCH
jgi:hypothetical protein